MPKFLDGQLPEPGQELPTSQVLFWSSGEAADLAEGKVKLQPGRVVSFLIPMVHTECL